MKKKLTKKVTRVIKPRNNPFKIDFRELFQYRELLWVLAYRDLRIKYAQTTIGLLWAILNPLLSVLLLSFVFGVIAKVDTNGVPTLLFTLVGMMGWNYFATIFSEAGHSIISSQAMVKKVYFPRLFIPLSKSLTAFVDFIVVFCFSLFFILWYQYPINWSAILYTPIFLFFTIIAGLTGGIWVSALTIRYRDFHFIASYMLRIGMYITPIAYPVSAVPSEYQILFSLNPMVGVIEGLRWSILGTAIPSFSITFSFLFLILFFIAGLVYFNRVEKVIADIV